MAMLSSMTRRDLEAQSYPPLVFIVAPLVAIGLQSLVALHFERFNILDLPLMVTIFFGLARREPITATLYGSLVGIGQDALTHLPIGVFGITNALIGFLAASLGVKIDVENHGTRLLLNFAFMLLHSLTFWIIARHMLATDLTWNWGRELIRAVANSIVAVILFALLDRTRVRD
jgi:rod shape-determining protein MreD